MNHIWTATSLVALLAVAVPVAQANPIAIYSTGTNASGTGLATAGNADPHWSLCSTTPTVTAPTTPCATTPTAAIVASTIPTQWAPDNSTSQWIGPKANEGTGPGGTDPAGYYEYETTFDLTGLLASTAKLTGSAAADNCIADVLINGTSTGNHNTDAGSACDNSNNYANFLAFSIVSGFVSGLNTLTFIMENASGASGNPSGLNVRISGTANPLPVPEPGTLGLFGLAALLGLGGLWIRRRG